MNWWEQAIDLSNWTISTRSIQGRGFLQLNWISLTCRPTLFGVCMAIKNSRILLHSNFSFLIFIFLTWAACLVCKKILIFFIPSLKVLNKYWLGCDQWRKSILVTLYLVHESEKHKWNKRAKIGQSTNKISNLGKTRATILFPA